MLHLLPRLCESFLRCLESYQYSISTSNQPDTSTIILKILPIDWVASRTTIPIPLPKAYASLARDIYDRCPAESVPTAYTSASLFQLAEIIPKSLDFSLSTNPLSCIAQNNTILHIAYAWKSSSQWLCISVTDKLGTLQWNASYSFGSAISNPWPAFREIAKEIWEGSLEMIDNRDSKRKVYVVKDEPMAQEEIEGTYPVPSRSFLANAISLDVSCFYVRSILRESCPPMRRAFATNVLCLHSINPNTTRRPYLLRHSRIHPGRNRTNTRQPRKPWFCIWIPENGRRLRVRFQCPPDRCCR